MHLEIGSVDLQGMGQLEAVRFAHPKPDAIIWQKFRRDHAGLGGKGEGASLLTRQPGCKTGKATGTIAAHLGFAAVGVVITHLGKLGCALDGDQAVSADPAMTVTQGGYLVTVQAAGTVAVINHDEVISRTIHLGELQIHRGSITPTRRDEKNEGRRL